MGKGRSRKGRRTKEMIVVAKERIDLLFSMAQETAVQGDLELANKYVGLAFNISTRYNIHLKKEHKILFCRKCKSFLLDTKSCRTRIRDKKIIKVCFTCEDVKRVGLKGKESS